MICAFDCPRSCTWAEKMDICRFQPIFDTLGDTTVNSTTVKYDMKIKDLNVAAEVAREMGARVLGHGNFEMYDNQYTGYAIKFPEWRFPIIIRKDGAVLADTYRNGDIIFGDKKTLEKFKLKYVIKMAEKAASKLGWTTQRTQDGILVFHPNGGYIHVSSDKLEAFKFVGNECHKATDMLAQKLGQQLVSIPRTEANAQHNQQTTS